MTGTGRIVDYLVGALAANPGMTAPELVAALGRTGLPASKAEINAALYREKARFWNDGAARPRWHLVVSAAPTKAEPVRREVPSDPVRPEMELFAWQAEALSAWAEAGHVGVVEAVTGTGKTWVGIAAVTEAVSIGAKAHVIVPTVELLRQWTAELARWLPDKRIGQLGAGARSSWATADVIVAVVNSARAANLGSPGPRSVLVADECHRYGSASNAQALDQRFERRLGLSATYARSDGGNTEHLEPYFGATCFRMDYRRAIDDDVTAHFKVALIGVPFAAGERGAYDEANRAAYEAQRWLIAGGHVREAPFGDFMQDVSRVAEGEHGRATWKARAFLSNFAERRRILAESPAKLEHLDRLVPAFRGADRAIVFTQTVDAACDAAAVLAKHGLSAEAVHSRLTTDERRRVLSRFADGRLDVISAPQVLDEGIDVPAADLAVILAASRTQRQMIQRMGRVLRRKPDGRLARFAVVYLEGSSEDPANGAHGDFLEEVTSVADEVAVFGSDVAPDTICAFLNDTERRPEASGPRPEVLVSPGATRVASLAPSSARRRQDAGSRARGAEAGPSPRAQRRANRVVTAPAPQMEPQLHASYLEQYRTIHGQALFDRFASEVAEVLHRVSNRPGQAIRRGLRRSSDPRQIEHLVSTAPRLAPRPNDARTVRLREAAVVVARTGRSTKKVPPGLGSVEPVSPPPPPPARRAPVRARYCPSCGLREEACRC